MALQVQVQASTSSCAGFSLNAEVSDGSMQSWPSVPRASSCRLMCSKAQVYRPEAPCQPRSIQRRCKHACIVNDRSHAPACDRLMDSQVQVYRRDQPQLARGQYREFTLQLPDVRPGAGVQAGPAAAGQGAVQGVHPVRL